MPNEKSRQIVGRRISLIDVLSSRSAGLIPHPDLVREDDASISVQMNHSIDRLIRTPNGSNLFAFGKSGEAGHWRTGRPAKASKERPGPKALTGTAQWVEKRPFTHCAIFAKGKALVFSSTSDDGGTAITLRQIGFSPFMQEEDVILSGFTPNSGDELAMLLAVSDIDDGHSLRDRRSQRAVVIAATLGGEAWVWHISSQVTSVGAETPAVLDNHPEIVLLFRHRLQVDSSKSHIVLPVDPMGWHQPVIDWNTDTALQDLILTVSTEGLLEFWTPQLGHHFPFGSSQHFLSNACDHNHEHDQYDHSPFTRSGVVSTGRANALLARCSSRKKTVLSESRYGE